MIKCIFTALLSNGKVISFVSFVFKFDHFMFRPLTRFLSYFPSQQNTKCETNRCSISRLTTRKNSAIIAILWIRLHSVIFLLSLFLFVNLNFCQYALIYARYDGIRGQMLSLVWWIFKLVMCWQLVVLYLCSYRMNLGKNMFFQIKLYQNLGRYLQPIF